MRLRKFPILLGCLLNATFLPGQTTSSQPQPLTIRDSHILNSEGAALVEDYTGRLLRKQIIRQKKPGFGFVDVYLANGPDIAFTYLGEIPLNENLGFLVGSQVFALEKFNDDEAGLSGTAETGSTILLDEDMIAWNFLAGLDVYAPRDTLFEGSKLFTGFLLAPLTPRYSEEEIDEFVAKDESPPINFKKSAYPYLLVEGQWARWFKTSTDVALGPAGDDGKIARASLGALLTYLDFEGGPTYIQQRIPGGWQKDTGIMARYTGGDGPVDLNKGLDKLPPWIKLQYGTISRNVETALGVTLSNSFAEGNYFTVEGGLFGFMLGLSSHSQAGTGFRFGLGFEPMFVATFQKNYVLNTLFGTKVNAWSINISGGFAFE